jgi:hypothetical protein
VAIFIDLKRGEHRYKSTTRLMRMAIVPLAHWAEKNQIVTTLLPSSSALQLQSLCGYSDSQPHTDGVPDNLTLQDTSKGCLDLPQAVQYIV